MKWIVVSLIIIIAINTETFAQESKSDISNNTSDAFKSSFLIRSTSYTGDFISNIRGGKQTDSTYLGMASIGGGVTYSGLTNKNGNDELGIAAACAGFCDRNISN